MFRIYFACYFDLFTATFYWLKQNAFLKWNNSLFSFPLEDLDRAGNKTFQWLFSPQSDDYREKKQWSFFHTALDGAFVGNHPPEPSQNKALLQKESSSDCCTDSIQSALCPRSSTIVTCSLSENSLCPPCLWPCPAQLRTKSLFGRPPTADLMKHKLRASSLWTTQDLINERSSAWPSVWCLAEGRTVGLPPRTLNLKTCTHPREKGKNLLGV